MSCLSLSVFFFFFFNDTATTEIYTLSLHDALPIATGKLPNSDFAWASSGEPLAGAIAVTFTLEPGEKLSVPMALSWDLPIIEYGHGRRWLRAYTDFFGASGTNAWKIAREDRKSVV